VTVVDESGTSQVLTRADALLRVDQVQKYFPVTRGIVFQKQVAAVKAVDGVTFSVRVEAPCWLFSDASAGVVRTVLREPFSGAYFSVSPTHSATPGIGPFVSLPSSGPSGGMWMRVLASMAGGAQLAR